MTCVTWHMSPDMWHGKQAGCYWFHWIITPKPVYSQLNLYTPTSRVYPRALRKSLCRAAPWLGSCKTLVIHFLFIRIVESVFHLFSLSCLAPVQYFTISLPWFTASVYSPTGAQRQGPGQVPSTLHCTGLHCTLHTPLHCTALHTAHSTTLGQANCTELGQANWTAQGQAHSNALGQAHCTAQLFQSFFPITDIATYRLNQPRGQII